MRGARHAEDLAEQECGVFLLFMDDQVGWPVIAQRDKTGQRSRHPHVRELVVSRGRIWISLSCFSSGLVLGKANRMCVKPAALDPVDEVRPTCDSHLVTCIARSNSQWCHWMKVAERRKGRHEKAHGEPLLAPQPSGLTTLK